MPFLDKYVLQFCNSITGELKRPGNGIIEKNILRELFKDDLPAEVVWRRKDGFSDGVSSTDKSWYQYINEFTDALVPDKKDCISKEAYYYKDIYNSFFPFYPNPIDNYWMPRWSKLSDPSNPSGRLISAFKL